jgi:hypothetical protein
LIANAYAIPRALIPSLILWRPDLVRLSAVTFHAEARSIMSETHTATCRKIAALYRELAEKSVQSEIREDFEELAARYEAIVGRLEGRIGH